MYIVLGLFFAGPMLVKIGRHSAKQIKKRITLASDTTLYAWTYKKSLKQSIANNLNMERLRKKWYLQQFQIILDNIKSYDRNVTEYGNMKIQLCVLHCPAWKDLWPSVYAILWQRSLQTSFSVIAITLNIFEKLATLTSYKIDLNFADNNITDTQHSKSG